jgi:serine/threonine protein phosphatase PrpC
MSWIRVAARSHVGCVRAINEDVWRTSPLRDELCVDIVVCDGMGGMGNGDEAAAVGAAAILRSLRGARAGEADRAAMRRALVTADVTVREALCTHERFPGCAAVVVRARPEIVTVGWVGDCRAYLVRDGAVVARTRDHRYTEDLVSVGELTPEQARAHPAYNVLTRAIGGRPVAAAPTSPSVVQWSVLGDDRLMLCSDGLWDLVEDDEIAQILTELPTSSAPEALVDHALSRGGHDNATAVVARLDAARPTGDQTR